MREPDTTATIRTHGIYLGVLLLLLIAVFALNVLAGGTITSPRNLAIDLASPPDTPQAWQMQNWPELKYRALFRLIVQGSWSALFAPNDAFAFYATFVFWSFAFFYATVVAFYFYLQLLDFDPTASFLGGLLFLVSPPVLLAYKYPVYTREDPLAYLLIVMGLHAIAKSKPWFVALFAVAAAMTRETTIVLPLAYLFAGKETRATRIAVSAAPVLALVGIRLSWGFVPGNPFSGSIHNFQEPFEALAFFFCIFGVLWLPFGMGFWSRWQRNDSGNYLWELVTRTAPVVLVLVIAATWALARVREIRIIYLVFPWVIPFALDWFRTNADVLKTWAADYHSWIGPLAIFGTLSALVVYFHLTAPDAMRAYLVDFKNGYWLVLGTLHLALLAALLLPFARRQSTLQAT